MTSSWDKFKLLMWKNWTLQSRHKIRTVIEILCPILFMALLVLIRSLVDPVQEDVTTYKPFKASTLILGLNTSNNEPVQGIDVCKLNFGIKISYSPKNPEVEKLITNSLLNLARDNILLPDNTDINNATLPEGCTIEQIQNAASLFELVGYPNAAALNSQLTNPLLNDTSYCGIEFDDSLKDLASIDQWPKDTTLALRFPAQLRLVENPVPFLNWRTDIAFPVVQFPGPRTRNSQYGGYPSYTEEGFMPVAHTLMREITRTLTKIEEQPDIWINRFPYPEYMNDILVPIMKAFISNFVLLAYCYPCINIIRSIAIEKEKQLKEVMKIMGLPNMLHWCAWFVKTFTFLMISTAIIVVIIKVEWYSTEDGLGGYSLFTNTPWHFILFFMVLYVITSISFFFMISTMFSLANTAATVGGLAWFLSNAPYTFITSDEYIPSTALRVVSCLISNTAMSWGFEIIFSYESASIGMQWSNVFTPVSDDDPFVMGHVILMMVLDTILYFLIALYIEQVFPGSYGVPQRWYFPVTKKFWMSICGSSEKDVYVGVDNEGSNHLEGIEDEPKHLNVGISIKQLSKVFKDKVAVDKLSLKIFENQITVLLGHNGAGKTTTMSMLTGVLPPTSGTATIAGYDIRTDIQGVRDSLGLCPQHNVLFNDLTVGEHIYFFSRLKGMSGNELDDEINRYVKCLGLEDKKNVKSSALSGGMKRRLSVATALCGNSKVVMLDEPTSGMDPSSRRELWNLLTSEKKGRTMILTTHFMDEAEILGERVAILSGGKLRCVGSPFYLKKKFGMGYRLTATRQTASPNGLPSSSAHMTGILQKYIPEAKLYTDIGSEISYILPDEQSSLFPPMLEELESNQGNLGIAGFGITASNLEDVFMRVGADLGKYQDDSDDTNFTASNENFRDIESSSSYKYYGTKLMLNQWKAILMKKTLVALRSWITHLLQLALPVLFITFGILSSRMYSNPTELPERTLELTNGYTNSFTFLEDHNSSYTAAYRKYFQNAAIESMKLVDVDKNKNMTTHYLDEARKDISISRMKNLVGATLNDKDATAWFSNFGHHEMPAAVMLIQNAILEATSPGSKITLINRPLPFSLQSQFDFMSFGNGSSFGISVNVALCLSFISAFFILFYIKESITRSKLLQLASGASPLTLWLGAYLWDMLWMVFVAGSLCCTMVAFQEDGLQTFNEIARVFLMTWIFGWAVLPINYFFSGVFKSPSSGFTRMILINAFSGMGAFITVEVLNTPSLELEDIGKVLHHIFLLFPHYAIASAVNNLMTAGITLNTCNSACEFAPVADCNLEALCKIQSACCISENPFFEWEKPGVGVHLTYMLLVGLLFIVMVIAREYKVHELVYKPKHSAPPPISPQDEDSDVAYERTKIMNVPPTDYTKYNLLSKQLTKYYNNFLAVDQLTLGVQDKECFGLLGINGAGKTTTFKMLTGDLLSSFGEAWVKGYSINSNMKEVHQNIGYCPQFDALLEEMTGRETLRMYSLLRGIPNWRQERFVASLGQKLGFTKHLDKQAGEYSGGNKRKLSTAIALLGDPQVVYLDEPTTGMDPAAKRLVWNAVSECNCVILTSHSMEECEALCSRIAIMVNGRPCCLGSPQHLKNKFSQGYTLIIKMKKINQMAYNRTSSPPTKYYNEKQELSMYDFEGINRFLLSEFSNVEVLEKYQGIITYHLPDTSIKWSKIFSIMESAKNGLNIEDYSIGQTTLEQIFLQFTKDQLYSEVDRP